MQSELVSLAALLQADRAGDRAVAFDAGTTHDWATFTSHVARLTAVVRDAGVRRWLVFFEDSYEFVVAVLAVAHAGGVSVLPPNGQAGTVARLAGEVEGFLLRASPIEDPRGPVLGDPLAAAAEPIPLRGLEDEMPFVEFFTSGSSGTGKRVAKRLRHLDEEVAGLESSFGTAVGDARFVSTVSHQHIYGALFRVLWPLAAGRPFSSRTYLHGGEAVARLAEARGALVASPVQLRAMAEAKALRGVAPVAIFSSGAPLDDRTAAAVAEDTGTPVSEIFGSTETGGVAWRQRPHGGDVVWRVFPGVEVGAAEDGRLSVCSRLVSVGAEAGAGRRRFVMGDRVEIVDDVSFRLRGRADRVVKIAAKRLSLPDMEAELVRNPDVAEAALVVIRRGIEPRVAAALVLTDRGRRRLGEMGRAQLGRQLAAALAPYFDRVLLPRAWRFVEALPRTPQGKLPEDDLLALFAAESGDGPVLSPVVEAESVAVDNLRRSCVVPENLAFFAGHFDDFAVVPGVAQLRWVVEAAETLLGAPLRVVSVDALKFKQPLLPGSRFDLEVRTDEDRKRVRFRLWRDDEDISTGRLVLD